MKCKHGYEIKPHKSAAGWYMGTFNELGEPMCRLSTDYAKTEEEAWKLPLNRGYAMEIQYCNGGGSCLEQIDKARECLEIYRKNKTRKAAYKKALELDPDIGVKDLVLNVQDRLLDALNFLESDHYVAEDTAGFKQLVDAYEKILNVYNDLKEYQESW